MTRPQVQINKSNHIVKLRAHLNKMLPEFIALPGLVGITLNGGLSRGYGDHLSEIDLTFFLNPATYQQWQAGQAPFGTGIQMIDGALYDLKEVDFEQEKARQWEDVALWDASYAEILHDSQDAIQTLLTEKLAATPSPLAAGGPLFVAWWNYKLAGDIWMHREDALQGHVMLNAALMEIVKAVFCANGEYIPHEKWLIHMSRSLSWKPANWIERLTTLLCDLTPTIEGLRQRQQYIADLWEEINQHIIQTAAPDHPLPLTHKYFYDLMIRLVDNDPIPVTQWNELTGLDILNQAPFNACVDINDGFVTLNRGKCASLTEHDIYAWHYAIVKVIQKRLRNGD